MNEAVPLSAGTKLAFGQLLLVVELGSKEYHFGLLEKLEGLALELHLRSVFEK